jgi:hypothetical protein
MRVQANAERFYSAGRPKQKTSCELTSKEQFWLTFDGAVGKYSLERVTEMDNQFGPAIRQDGLHYAIEF